MGEDKIKNKFEGADIYRTTHPSKVAMLLTMGAKWIDTDIENIEKIEFILQHEKINQMVYQIHSGQNIQLMTYQEHYRKIMEFIKDTKKNIKMGVKYERASI